MQADSENPQQIPSRRRMDMTILLATVGLTTGRVPATKTGSNFIFRRRASPWSAASSPLAARRDRLRDKCGPVAARRWRRAVGATRRFSRVADTAETVRTPAGPGEWCKFVEPAGPAAALCMKEMNARANFPSAVAADDAALVAQACAGNDRAFETLYRRHVRYVAGVTYRLLGDDAEVDDVLQEAFIDAAAALRGLRQPAEFRAWIARIAVRRVYRRLARRRRWRWLRAAVEVVTPNSSDPHTRQRVHDLYEALTLLPAKLRVPWTLHVIDGETLPDVARLCDTSLATVKRRIAEAGARVGRRLGGDA
jgi:RNA polymerase sigma-70 factor (ECF subfamily)